jgi:hypothetical protein
MAAKKQKKTTKRRSAKGGPDISAITGDVQSKLSAERGDFVFGTFGFYRKTKKKPCAWDGAKPMHRGRVELEIVSNESAAELGVKPGPAIRLCIKPNQPAPIVSVSDPVEALAIATKFRDCAVKKKSDPRACGINTIAKARKIPAAKVRIAGLGRSHK